MIKLKSLTQKFPTTKLN